jgi:hypothetical protein
VWVGRNGEGDEVTPQSLKDDAIKRQYKPGALVRTISGALVLLTSWPWLEGEGDDQCSMIMARTDPQDPSTNRSMRYFTLMRREGEADL